MRYGVPLASVWGSCGDMCIVGPGPDQLINEFADMESVNMEALLYTNVQKL